MLILLSTALAAGLHQCEGIANSPNGTTLSIRAFGDSELEAQRSLRQSARFLVDQHLLMDAARGWYTNDAASLDRLAESIHKRGSPTFAAPGWTLELSECTALDVSEGNAWSARWGEEGPEVTRSHPADALEASRRRACVSAYQIGFMQTLKAAVDADPADQTTKLAPWSKALRSLQTCWAGEVPSLRVVEATPASTRPAQCTAISYTGGRLAIGYGAGAERAAEDALKQSILVRSRRIIGRLGRARNITQPAKGEEAARRKIVDALERIAGLTGASDSVDRARLVCNEVEPGALVWKPSDSEARTCNDMSWTERPTTGVKVEGVGAFQDETCGLQVDSTLQIVRYSLRGSEGSKRDAMAAGAFMVTGICESACYGNTRWGTLGKPLVLEGSPNRTSKRAVLAELRSLEPDPMDGMRFFPTLQDPDALRGLFDGTLIPRVKAEANRLPADRWRELDGHWIVKPE